MKRIVLSGGGTAGHVTPILALLPTLRSEGWELHYIGSHNGMERALIEAEGDITYHAVSTGKLRRYLSLRNCTDPFRVLSGIHQARRILRKLKPSIVFSKGGYVGLPAAVGARGAKVPVVLHEADLTPGLANKLALPYAQAICVSFPETVQYISKKECVYTGIPVREELFRGDREEGKRLFGLNGEKPVMLIMGGSSGAQAVNAAVRAALPELLTHFQILHITGAGNKDESLEGREGYCQREYLREELPHAFALCDIALSRAGSNAIHEFLALRIPTLLVPYPRSASRGDQIVNAESFRAQGFADVIEQEQITSEKLVERLCALYDARETYKAAMSKSEAGDSVAAVMDVIHRFARD